MHNGQDDGIWTVSEVNTEIKSMLEGYGPFRNIYVEGEISNYKQHTSGHHYLTLKDESSSLSAVLFRSDASRLAFRLSNGMKVIARGRISSFPKNGQYQMYIADLMESGAGALYLAFEKLKKKLYNEGLFALERKKPLPRFPNTIAVVTSPTGAAVQDILRILKRRYPLAAVRIYPALVQGEGAGKDIAKAIEQVNLHNSAEVMIVGRGGGSMEDLWAFNEEIVARAIYQSKIPVISAVGHEPDITISDLVADVRASTPSNAAELAVQMETELKNSLLKTQESIGAYINQTLLQNRKKLSELTERLNSRTPAYYIAEKHLLVDQYTKSLFAMAETKLQKARQETERQTLRLQAVMNARLIRARQRYIQNTAALDALSPLKVLARGYSIVLSENGKAVTDSVSLKQGDILDVQFYQGGARCSVVELQEGKP